MELKIIFIGNGEYEELPRRKGRVIMRLYDIASRRRKNIFMVTGLAMNPIQRWRQVHN